MNKEDIKMSNAMFKETIGSKAVMLKKARKAVEAEGYSVFGGVNSTLTKKCPQCGAVSLMGCISEDKKYIIALCTFRYHKDGKRCRYYKKWENTKINEDRKEATPNAV
jgi:hypothetical protein